MTDSNAVGWSSVLMKVQTEDILESATERPDGTDPLLEELGTYMEQLETVVVDSTNIYQLAVDILASSQAADPNNRAPDTAIAEVFRGLHEFRHSSPTRPVHLPKTGKAPSYRPKAVDAIVDDWKSRKIPKDQQEHMANLLIQGFGEEWTNTIAEQHANNLERLDAWSEYGFDTDLRPWLGPAMKQAVARWLSDDNIHNETLRLLPAMIRSGISVNEIDVILNARTFPERMEIAFGRSATAPIYCKYGLISLQTLRDWLVGEREQEGLELVLARVPDHLSQVRRVAGDLRQRLHQLIHAMESLRATIRRDRTNADYCGGVIKNWISAALSLNTFLTPTLEADLTEDPGLAPWRMGQILDNLKPPSSNTNET